MSFKDLKRNRAALIDDLVEKASKMEKGNYDNDKKETEYWKPTADKTGTGSATIRFLPASGDSDAPWVRYFDHGFQGPKGQWYIEKSLTSLPGNPKDPVSEANSVAWAEGNKALARKRKRRLHYVSNILVVKDDKNPDSVGKVFKYEYGKRIFDMIMDAMKPQFDDETPINPFDFWEGANFLLKFNVVDDQRSYAKSSFGKPTALCGGDDEKLEKLYDSLYDLSSILDPKSFKSYEELERRFIKVTGETPPPINATTASAPEIPSAPEPKMELKAEPETVVDDEDEDDMKDFFNSIKDDDDEDIPF